MKLRHLQGLQLPWPLIEWMLDMERRVSKFEVRGETTTDRKGERRTWEARDYMMAGAGISMVIAALFEKAGWSTVIAGLVRLYGGK